MIKARGYITWHISKCFEEFVQFFIYKTFSLGKTLDALVYLGIDYVPVMDFVVQAVQICDNIREQVERGHCIRKAL